MLIAFDIKAEKTDNALVFAIEDENTSYAAFVLNAGGKMYFNSDKELADRGIYARMCKKLFRRSLV